MANLAASHPAIALHISDRNHTPLLTSARSLPAPESTPAQAQALHALTTISINAYETARHLGYGSPQRIMLETANNGPVLLQSYLNPSSVTSPNLNGLVESTNGFLINVGRPSTGASEQTTSTELAVGQPSTNGFDTDHGSGGEEHSSDESSAIQTPPMLFTTVVVPRRTNLNEGRRVAVQIERIGRQFQREWSCQQVAESEQALMERPGDDDV